MLYTFIIAVVAQLVEQLIRNEQVAGSSPVRGSKMKYFVSFLIMEKRKIIKALFLFSRKNIFK